jgi:glycine cleavage system regulatory protein
MATLVLTVVGADRAGLVAAVADVVDAHGGNWENSQLAELAGAFAGIIEVSVDAARVDALRSALSGIDGLVTVALPAAGSAAEAARTFSVSVLGNDRPGIVREVSSTLSEHGFSIERMTTEVRDAAMAGGRLFEASIVATAAASVDLAAVTEGLERLANELQVDVTLAD